ncbi:MAG: long-chain-fatty-acid--CoA ligase [Gammaproteobacteria bacterium]|nr:MAG: long-chain-fatty-acid--CoA ligase [Gammaproteobacteria bacterium]
MVEKIWLSQYPEGIPETIDADRIASLKHLIETSFEKYRDLPAFTNMGHSITYGELDQMSRYFGAYLQKVAGLQKGERVAIMLPNVLQYPVAVFGILRAGLCVVNVNPLYTPRELEHQLKDSGAKVILILENFATTLEKVVDKTDVSTIITTGVGDLLPFPKGALTNFVVRRVKKMVPPYSLPSPTNFPRSLKEGKWQTLDDVELDHDDLAFLQYTGGTTGVSKGAILTHGNIVSNVLQAEAWCGTMFSEGAEIAITALPLYHIFSLTANCMMFSYVGGNNVLITNPRDFDGFVNELKKYPFTFISGVNTLFNALLNTPGFDQVDFSPMKIALGGGMAVQKPVADHWKKVTGKPILQAYGLTETSPAACINPPDMTEFNGSIGVPISSTDVAIRDEDGADLALGEVGEICIRGPQVMAGYWQRPEETAKTMFQGGWLRTGDMGRMDESGFVFITDRKKDMILVSGFNVFPNEIEDVVVGMDGVLEAAAIGVPDEKSGEIVKLFVVRKDESLTEDEVRAYCKEHLTGYKRPKVIEFREDLPKTNVGKILRRALRDG